MVAFFPCVSSTILACLCVTCPLLLFLPARLCERRAPFDWLSKYRLAILTLSLCLFLFFLSLLFYLILLFPLSVTSPSSSYISLHPILAVPSHGTPSLSLILLCGGFAVDSPRHEWSISRSPGGSSPYNSVQWARIVSQLTQKKNLCVNTVILWAASLQCVYLFEKNNLESAMLSWHQNDANTAFSLTTTKFSEWGSKRLNSLASFSFFPCSVHTHLEAVSHCDWLNIYGWTNPKISTAQSRRKYFMHNSSDNLWIRLQTNLPSTLNRWTRSRLWAAVSLLSRVSAIIQRVSCTDATLIKCFSITAGMQPFSPHRSL